MKDKINVAELLKDCPKGIEFDCTICNGVKFIELDRNPNFPIVVRANNGYEFSLTKYGQVHNIDDTKCVIFPKGKTTWEGFVPPYKYPKTYEECCDVLKIEYPYFKTEEDGISASTYKNKLFGALKQLLICRDAYWKIAGEQMGLGKPWKPDWAYNCIKYIITVAENEIYTDVSYIFNYILVFPTEEMRDAFYENFKELINETKELL